MEAPQPPPLTIIPPTPREFTFPDPSDSTYPTPSCGTYVSNFDSMADRSSPLATPSLLSLIPSPTLSLPRLLPLRKSVMDFLRSQKSPSSNVERRPKKGDEDYIKRPENAFILFRRKCLEERQAQDATNGLTGEKQRQADLPKTISQQWRSQTPEERKYWEDLAKEKKKEHAQMYPTYVYPVGIRAKGEEVKNQKLRIMTTTASTDPSKDEEHMSSVVAPHQHSRSVSPRNPEQSNAPLSDLWYKYAEHRTQLQETPSDVKVSDQLQKRIKELEEEVKRLDDNHKNPPNLFSESKDFCINGGEFNAISGDMHSVITHHNESTKTFIFKGCVFSDPSSDSSDRQKNPPPSMSDSVADLSSIPSSSPPTIPESANPSSCPPPSYPLPPTSSNQSQSSSPNTCYPSPKRNSRWSTTTFVYNFYNYYVQPVMLYPISWIGSHFVPGISGWFASPPPPPPSWSYWWPH